MKTSLDKVCKIKYGKDHKKLSEGNIPVYGTGGIMRYVNKSISSGPSVLIPRKGTLGNLFYSDKPFWTVDTLFWTIINEEVIIPKYLYYLLKDIDLASLNIGTAVPSLSVDVLKEIQFDIPNKTTQTKIIQILSSLDSKIELNNQINDYLAELLLAKYDQLFGTFDSNSCDGTLADIGEVVGGATPSKKKDEYYCHDGIGWITPRDLSNTTDIFIAHGADDITQLGYDSCSAKLLPKGSVLFSSRAPIGYLAIATDDVATNQGFKSVIPNDDIGTAFVYCFLYRNRQRIADMGSGTTFPEVSGKTMKNVELKIPDKAACSEFSTFAEPVLSMLENNERENRELVALRDSLLPKLMSGEIDVSRISIG